MQKLSGTVISVASPNTVVVAIVGSFSHPKYKKIIKRTTRVSAHTEKPVKVGDKVSLVKSRPYSKAKHFKIS